MAAKFTSANATDALSIVHRTEGNISTNWGVHPCRYTSIMHKDAINEVTYFDGIL